MDVRGYEMQIEELKDRLELEKEIKDDHVNQKMELLRIVNAAEKIIRRYGRAYDTEVEDWLSMLHSFKEDY